MPRRIHQNSGRWYARLPPSKEITKETRISAPWPAVEKISRQEVWVFLCVSTVWVMLLYWRILSAPFVYDDLAQIVHNPNLSLWHNFAQRFLFAPVSFTNDLGREGGATYRPLYWFTFFVDAKLWGLRATGFHATNLVLHLANGVLGFLLLRRLHVALPVAAGACLVWLGLPINSEVVAWVSGRSYSLCGVFVLLSLLSAVAYWRTGAKAYLAGCFTASLAALLSNELGVLVLPLTGLLFSRQQRSTGWRKIYPVLLGWSAAAGTYFGVKLWVGAHAIGRVSFKGNFGSEFWRYVDWIALPVRMSVERSTSVPAAHFGWSSLAAMIGLLALAVACFLLRGRLPQLSGGVTWMLLALLPFCGLVTIYQGMAERFVYFASAGFAFAVVVLAFQRHKLVRGLLLGCVAVWVVWGAWRLHERVLDWCDPVMLYAHSLDANPTSPSLHFNLAFSLRQEGDFQGARDAYLDTIELQRDYPHALTSLGELYLQAGQLDNAEKQFVRSIALFPDDSSTYTNLGVIFSQRQLPRDAARMFSKAIEKNSTSPTPYYNLAVIFQQAGHGDMALPLYRKVLELEPGDPDTLANMKKIQGVR